MKHYIKTWRKHAIAREGLRYKVYIDTVGKPTAGIGHLLSPSENKTFKIGDKVSKEQVEKWFKRDTEKAVKLAIKQAAEIGLIDDWFIVALISANFQLGNFRRKFSKTRKGVFTGSYALIVKHEYDQAIINLRKSLWYRQTPTRVNDLIHALERARDFKARPLAKTRTAAGAGVASIGVVSSEIVTDIIKQIEPIADYSDSVNLLFVVLTLVGIGLMVRARIDDRKNGYR